MKFSIIIVTYNCISKKVDLKRTINSVLSQKYKNIELVIVDGNSNDGTKDLISKYHDFYEDMRIKFISEPDNGIYDAMNKGIRESEGDVLYFLNAGDYFIDNFVLEDINNFFEENKDTKIAYGNIVTKDAGKEFNVTVPLDLKHLKLGIQTPHQATFAKKEALINGFDSSYSVSADLDWFIKKVLEKTLSKYIDRNIAFFEFNSNAKRPNKWEGIEIINKYFGPCQALKAKIRVGGKPILREFARKIGILDKYYDKKVKNYV